MKKQTDNKKKMTTSEVGELVVKLSNKTNTQDKKLNIVAESINQLAVATAKGFDGIHRELKEFKEETRENFAQVRRNILDIRDTYATKNELKKVVVRVETLEEKK